MGRWTIAWAVGALAVIVWAGSFAEEDAVKIRAAVKAVAGAEPGRGEDTRRAEESRVNP